MSNDVVKVLDETVARLSKSLGKDAGKAVEDLYRDTGGKLKDVVKNTVETDAKKAEDIKKILADMDKNAARKVESGASAEERKALEKEQQRVQAKLHRDLAKAMDPESAAAKKQLKKTSDELGDALTATGDKQPADKWAAHHIVPEYQTRAGMQDARNILAKAGIPIASAENGVWLPPSTAAKEAAGFAGHAHSRIHTNAYGLALKQRLEALGDNPSRQDVVGELAKIRTEIQAGTFPK